MHSVFPQISRKIPAALSFAGTITRWTILGSLMVFNALAWHTNPPVWTELQKILTTPYQKTTYAQLSQLFFDERRFSRARTEHALALEQTPSNVLGATTDTAVFNTWDQLPTILPEQMTYWKSIVDQKKTYRDGYLHLAATAYQMGNDIEAKEYIEEVKKLDPNNTTLEKLSGLLNGK